MSQHQTQDMALTPARLLKLLVIYRFLPIDIDQLSYKVHSP